MVFNGVLVPVHYNLIDVKVLSTAKCQINQVYMLLFKEKQSELLDFLFIHPGKGVRFPCS